MKKTTHPYKEFEEREIWQVLNRAISALARNGDLRENTAREYVVGYLAKTLTEAGFIPVSDLRIGGKPIRVVEVQQRPKTGAA